MQLKLRGLKPNDEPLRDIINNLNNVIVENTY